MSPYHVNTSDGRKWHNCFHYPIVHFVVVAIIVVVVVVNLFHFAQINLASNYDVKKETNQIR